jgi:hypothetical protein
MRTGGKVKEHAACVVAPALQVEKESREVVAGNAIAGEGA